MRHSKWMIFIVFFAFLAVFYWGCADREPVYVTENEVKIEDNAYLPRSMTVVKGMEVTWVNQDETVHTVTSGAPDDPEPLFDSGDLMQGDRFSMTFDSIGSFPYYCRHHPDTMIGMIIVQQDTTIINPVLEG